MNWEITENINPKMVLGIYIRPEQWESVINIGIDIVKALYENQKVPWTA